MPRIHTPAMHLTLMHIIIQIMARTILHSDYGMREFIRHGVKNLAGAREKICRRMSKSVITLFEHVGYFKNEITFLGFLSFFKKKDGNDEV